jgi:AICAR transformylase/IMP cyclohydrolase PurH
MKRIALFSLSDTSSVEQFAEQLIKSGWEIIASPETVSLLKGKGLPVQDIANFTAVKEDYAFAPTLHPKVEYALTANSQPCIDLVYVIPYPASVGNDVGGRALLALAVKGGRIAVMGVEDMKTVVSEISATGEISPELRLELADKVCFELARHYSSLVANREKYDFLAGNFSYDLLNGENPYQVPASAFVSEIGNDSLSLLNFKQVSGQPPCFTNMADADCILKTICLAAEAFILNSGSLPYLCVAAKHGNACGMGVSKTSPAQAVEKALLGNPRAIWGGEAITNFPVDKQLAELFLQGGQRKNLLGNGFWMLDLVMAPSFTNEAISTLSRRKARKLFENKALQSPMLKKTGFTYRLVRGGFLRQAPASYILNLKSCQQQDKGLSEGQRQSLLLAWAVAFSSFHGGNEIALAKDGALLSAAGGPSTVEAVRTTIARLIECGHATKGAIFAANAFFPFTDAPALLCGAGITIGCVPGGGKHETQIKDFFHTHAATVVYLPQEFRGFCRH